MATITVTELRSSGNNKRGRSSTTLVEFDDHGSKVNKKQRIRYSISEMLSFSSNTTTTITSSFGKENRIPLIYNYNVESNRMSITPEINELFIKKSSGRKIVESVKKFSDDENGRIVESVSLVKDDHDHDLLREEENLCNETKGSCCSESSDSHAIVSNVVNKHVKLPGNNITGQERSKSNPVSEGEKRVIIESKTLRVEMLKKRFSHLIVKAQQEELLSRSENIDPVKMKKEKEILEKKLKEAQFAAEAELKKELQRKREAARMALLELERTVEVDDNIKTMKEFAMLLGYPKHCAACVSNEVGWHGLSFSNTSGTSDWRKR